MPKTKQKTALSVSFLAVSQDVVDIITALLADVTKAVKDGTKMVVGVVEGSLDGMAGRVYDARPVGLSIPSLHERIKKVALPNPMPMVKGKDGKEEPLKPCSELALHKGKFVSALQAVACLKGLEKDDLELAMTACKHAKKDKFDSVLEYISTRTGSKLDWDRADQD